MFFNYFGSTSEYDGTPNDLNGICIMIVAQVKQTDWTIYKTKRVLVITENNSSK